MIGEELDDAAASEGPIPDRRLALMFACAHPAIDEAIRAPLMLQTILGLDAAAIASAFLVSPAAMGQRLARAKAKIKLAGIPFRIPETDELAERLGAVLEAIYAAFAHGWAEAFADDPRGRNLAEEAIWLGRVVVALAARRARGAGAARTDALCGFAARRPARFIGALCPAQRTEPGALERGRDRGSRGPAADRQREAQAGALSAGGGDPIGACRAPSDRRDGLAGDSGALRGAVRAHRLAGRRRQPGRRGRQRPRRRRGASTARERRRRRAIWTAISPIGRPRPISRRASATRARRTATGGRSASKATRRPARSCWGGWTRYSAFRFQAFLGRVRKFVESE